MSSPRVVKTRISRHADKSFGDGSQPLAMASSLAAFRPSQRRKRGKIYFGGTFPLSSSADNSLSEIPAAPAAAAVETLVIARALRMMSPRWSSRFMRQNGSGQNISAQARGLFAGTICVSNSAGQSMFGSKRNKETERFYLLPGQGGQAYRRKQKFILNMVRRRGPAHGGGFGGADVLAEPPELWMARLTRCWRLLICGWIR